MRGLRCALKFLGKNVGVDGATMRSSRLCCRLGMLEPRSQRLLTGTILTRQQIYAWRSELKKKGLLSASSNALFIPVDMNAVQTDVADDRERCSGMIELRLSCGRTLRFGSAVDTAALTQLIRAVEAA
jgi:hypothetical protein